MQLQQKEGVTVTGEVEDVRPYLAAARAAIAPLRIARGIQNKVLEALAMGKPVLASEEVCRTFQPEIPQGIMCCTSPRDYARAVEALPPTPAADMAIADAARRRFGWEVNLAPLVAALAEIENGLSERR
jgi:glycosyltransferase involved in cell wall biosynthesis